MELPSSLAEIVAGYRATPNVVGESGGAIHQLDAVGRPALFLKQGRDGVATDIADEYARLRWLQGRWQVPKVVSYAETDAGAWLLTTALAGRAAYGWLEDRPERRDAAMRSIAKFLRQMHAEPIATCPFDAGLGLRSADATANVAAGLVDLDELDPEREGWSAEQLWAHFQRLLPIEADRVVTHGDFSLDNIFLDDDGAVTGCLDLGRVGVADRYQDLAILWNSLREFDLGLAEAMFDAYGVAPDRAKMELHLLFDEFF